MRITDTQYLIKHLENMLKSNELFTVVLTCDDGSQAVYRKVADGQFELTIK